MNTNFALALSFASIFSFAVGCSSVEVEPIDGTTSGAPTGTSTTGGGGGTGPAAICEPGAAPDQSACELIPYAHSADQSAAQKALVGHWYRCSSMDGLIESHGAAGIAFLPDGKFKLLETDNAQIVCRSGFDEEGTWALGEDSGMGLPTEYDLLINWDGGGFSSADIFFANEKSYLRIANDAGGHDDLIRVP